MCLRLAVAKLNGKPDAQTDTKTGTDAVLEFPAAVGARGKPVFMGNFGGRDRDRTGDLLVANDVQNNLRRGVAIT